jgi:hypothetical protein
MFLDDFVNFDFGKKKLFITDDWSNVSSTTPLKDEF